MSDYCLHCGNTGRTKENAYRCIHCGRQFRERDTVSNTKKFIPIPAKYKDLDYDIPKGKNYQIIKRLLEFSYRNEFVRNWFVCGPHKSGLRSLLYTLIQKFQATGKSVEYMIANDLNHENFLNPDFLIIYLVDTDLIKIMENLNYYLVKREQEDKVTIIFTRQPINYIMGLRKSYDYDTPEVINLGVQ